MTSLVKLFRRFRSDENGAFAIIFAVMAIVLVALGGAAVDFVTLQQARNRAQLALDAATLGLQRDITKLSKAEIMDRAEDLLIERIGDSRVTATIEDAVIDTEQGSLKFLASVDVPTMFVRLVGVPQLAAGVASQATRGSVNLEFSVAVDLTGSMNEAIKVSNSGSAQQTKVAALRAALNTLIDIVVQTDQEPTYSKMAIVPYSMGVNVGSYAETIRGTIRTPSGVTGLSWASGPARTITGASASSSEVVVTSANHGFKDGDRIFITGVKGMTPLNEKIFTVKKIDVDKFRLLNSDGTNLKGSSFTPYTKDGTATPCLTSNCELVVTAPKHGLSANENVYLFGLQGVNNYSTRGANNWVNNNPNGDTSKDFLVWKIGAVTTDTFVLSGSSRTLGDRGTYTYGGAVSCVLAGCEYFYYQNAYGDVRRQRVSTCVTERTTNAYTDASPATTLLGRNYPSGGNPCLNNTIVPLTDNKTTLHNIADSLQAGGSTAGHTGVAWAWYLISGNFHGPWPAASQPAPASKPNVLKAVVIMTDGEFNSVYCNGVISYKSTVGSGDPANQINCAAPNGSSYDQATKLCEQINKLNESDGPSANIRVYTVGFDVVNSASARNLMQNCASDPSMAYEAATGADLKAVFADIGQNLAQLRLTQ